MELSKLVPCVDAFVDISTWQIRGVLNFPLLFVKHKSVNSTDFADRKQAFFLRLSFLKAPINPQSSVLSQSQPGVSNTEETEKARHKQGQSVFYSSVVCSVGHHWFNSSGLKIWYLFHENFILYCPLFSVTASSTTCPVHYTLYTMCYTHTHYTLYFICLHFTQSPLQYRVKYQYLNS